MSQAQTTRRRFASLGAAAAAIALVALAAVSASAGATARASANQVELGAILSLSGVLSTLGPPEQAALQMGIDKVNKGGGFSVAGKKYTFKLKVLDDQSNFTSVGVADFRQLVDVDKVPVIVLSGGATFYKAALQRSPLAALDILDSTYPSILDADPHLFLLRSDTPAYVPGSVYYAKHKLHVKKLAFIGTTELPYSGGLETWVKKAAAKYGVKVAAAVNWPAGTTDFAPFIQKAMASKPDAIYLGGVTGEILPVAKQLYESGVHNIPVLHSSGVTPDQAKALIGAQLYNKVMANNYDFAGTLPGTSTNRLTKAFAKAYTARTHNIPEDLTMWAYDTPLVLAAAMQQAGSVTDRDKIYKAMFKVKIPKGTVSGWVPAAGGKLFHGRDAQTLEQGMKWCTNKATIAPVFTYFLKGLNFTTKRFTPNACGA